MKKNFWENLTRIQILYLGIAVFSTSILLALLSVYFYLYFWAAPGSVFPAFCSFLCLTFSLYCFRKYRSFSIDKNKDADFKDQPYILYLRSFNDDSETSVPLNIAGLCYTEEEILISSLKRLGKAVAIGRPDEQAPPLGAKRIYVMEDQWQDKVQELSVDARLVIFRLGETEGLKWEWNNCLNSIEDISKLLLVVPTSITEKKECIDQLVTKIKTLRDGVQCEKIDPSYLLNIGSIGLILYFEKNEDGTFTAKQTCGIRFLRPFSKFTNWCTSWCRTRSENGSLNMVFRFVKQQFFSSSPFETMRQHLKPVVDRLKLPSFEDKLERWLFQIVKIGLYISIPIAVIFIALLICDYYNII